MPAGSCGQFAQPAEAMDQGIGGGLAAVAAGSEEVVGSGYFGHQPGMERIPVDIGPGDTNEARLCGNQAYRRDYAAPNSKPHGFDPAIR